MSKRGSWACIVTQAIFLAEKILYHKFNNNFMNLNPYKSSSHQLPSLHFVCLCRNVYASLLIWLNFVAVNRLWILFSVYQSYKPGYTAPPQVHHDETTIEIRFVIFTHEANFFPSILVFLWTVFLCDYQKAVFVHRNL